MQIRRYTGAELSEVLRRVQRELRPNAAIINTRKMPEVHQHPSLSDALERVHRAPVRNQVEADLSRQILRVFDEQLSLLGEDWERAQPRFERYLGGLIRTAPGIQLREGKKPVVAMFI